MSGLIVGFVPAILNLKQKFQFNLRGFTGSESGKEGWLSPFDIIGYWFVQ